MRKTLPSLVAVGFAVLLSACSSFSIAPAIYEEDRSNPNFWSLILTYEGRYYLSRLSPLPPPATKVGDPVPANMESEQGTWTMSGNQVLLKSDAGAARTFSVLKDFGGTYLREEAKDSPVLRWTTQDIGVQ